MRRLTYTIVLVLFFLPITYHLQPVTYAHASVPHLINYQGRLTDKSEQPLEGAYSLTFRIYDAQSAGNLLWEETHSGVVIQKGIFSIILGSITSLNLPFDKAYFLEILVAGELMSPRQRITSAGYAIRAENAEVADTITDPTFLVPKGAIIMCKNSCPSGYRRIGELDGKFLVGGVSYNSSAGGSNTHTHAAGSYTAPSHTHSANTGTALLTSGTANINHTALEHSDYHYHSFTTGAGGGSAITGTSASADNRPVFATVVLCEKE